MAHKRLWQRAAVAVFIFSLSGCELFKALFGPNSNLILSWWPEYPVGTKLTYTEYERGAPDSIWPAEVLLVDKQGSSITIRVSAGLFPYWIYDDLNGLVAWSLDPLVDDTDIILLKTPVRVGTTWQAATFYEQIPDVTHTITAVDSTLTTAAGTFEDVVVIQCSGPNLELHGCQIYEDYYSASAGFIGLYCKLTEGIESVVHLTSIERP